MSLPVVSLQGLVWHSLFEMQPVTVALELLQTQLNMYMKVIYDTKTEDLTTVHWGERNNFLFGLPLNTDVRYHTESG